MTKIRIDDCRNCSGRGYHQTKTKVWDPNAGIWIEAIETIPCGSCGGNGYIEKVLEE